MVFVQALTITSSFTPQVRSTIASSLHTRTKDNSQFEAKVLACKNFYSEHNFSQPSFSPQVRFTIASSLHTRTKDNSQFPIYAKVFAPQKLLRRSQFPIMKRKLLKVVLGFLMLIYSVPNERLYHLP
jgi:hypothetical protein